MNRLSTPVAVDPVAVAEVLAMVPEENAVPACVGSALIAAARLVSVEGTSAPISTVSTALWALTAAAKVYVVVPTVTVWPGVGTGGGTVKFPVARRGAAPPARSPPANTPQPVETEVELPPAPVLAACSVIVVAVEPVAVAEALATVPEAKAVPTCAGSALMAAIKLARVVATLAVWSIRTVSTGLWALMALAKV
jgi:hypothetical protein